MGPWFMALVKYCIVFLEHTQKHALTNLIGLETVKYQKLGRKTDGRCTEQRNSTLDLSLVCTCHKL